MSETFSYGISVRVIDVYNEQIRDLLATGNTSKRYFCYVLLSVPFVR